MKLNRPVQESWNQLKKINPDEWVAQPKFDGIRTNIQVENKIGLIGEDGRLKSHQYPEIVMGAISSKIPEGTVLDGELCIIKDDYNADLYSLLSRQVGSLGKATKLAKTNPATFVAFDIIKYKNESTKDMSFQSRYDILKSLNLDNKYIKTIQNYNPLELVQKIQPYNMEGMVLKRKNSMYHSKWFKMKYYEEYDFKIVGTTSKTRLISSLELEDPNSGDYVGKVNSNNLIKQTADFARSVIGKQATVRCRMTDKGKVREPVLIRIK